MQTSRIYISNDSSINQLTYSNPDNQNVIFLSYLRDSLASQLEKELIYNYWLIEVNNSPNLKEQKIEQARTDHEQDKLSSELKQLSEEQQILAKQTNCPHKSDAKNIPKNFGKAIITFIKTHKDLVKNILIQYDFGYREYLSSLKARRKRLNTISDLRSLWLDDNFKYAKITRILSLYFLRHRSLNYVFSSKLKNVQSHIKYRARLMEAVKNPKQFTYIKTY